MSKRFRVAGESFCWRKTVERLSAGVTPLHRIFKDDDYPIGLAGTAVRLSFADRFLVLATAHQLLDTVDGPKHYHIRSRLGGCFLNAADVRILNPAAIPSQAGDVMIMDFTASLRLGYFRRSDFFPLKREPSLRMGERTVGYLALGYPDDAQELLLCDDETGAFRGWRLKMVHAFAEPLDPDPLEPSLLRMQFVTPFNATPKGLSGAPVFRFTQGALTRVGFAGIITMAGPRSASVIPSGLISRLLPRMVDGWPKLSEVNRRQLVQHGATAAETWLGQRRG